MLALRFLASIDQSLLFVVIFFTPTSKVHSLLALFVQINVNENSGCFVTEFCFSYLAFI